MDQSFSWHYCAGSLAGARDCDRVPHFSRQRFRSKFFAYANTNGLALASTGLYSHAKPYPYADSAASNKNYREPDSNSCTLTHSDSYAARQSQPAGESYSNSNAWISGLAADGYPLSSYLNKFCKRKTRQL
jgi:hypothetical protein